MHDRFNNDRNVKDDAFINEDLSSIEKIENSTSSLIGKNTKSRFNIFEKKNKSKFG